LNKRSNSILLLTSTAVLFAVTLVVFGKVVGVASPWFALVVMLDLLGLIALGRPLFLLRMPGPLRTLRAWELRGRLYRRLAVPAFGALLRRTPLRYLNPDVYLGKSRDDFANVIAQLEGAETAHFWAGMLITPYIAYACSRQWWDVVGWFVLLQVLGNLYPVLHLRWARARLGRLLAVKRLDRRD